MSSIRGQEFARNPHESSGTRFANLPDQFIDGSYILVHSLIDDDLAACDTDFERDLNQRTQTLTDAFVIRWIRYHEHESSTAGAEKFYADGASVESCRTNPVNSRIRHGV